MITTSTIPMFDCAEQSTALQDEILAIIEDVLAGGKLVLGPRVEAFEERFAEFLGVEGYAVGVGNGTDALAIALRSLEIGPGDEVITVANTAVPTATAIRMVGARPVFCEIDPHTLLMDVCDAESRITARTKAVIPVHLFGSAVNMPDVVEMADRNGLAVVEDCAQSCGTTWGGQHTGTFGEVGCFSFYPTKNLGAYGDGGLCFTRHKLLADAMRQIRAYGCDDSRTCRRDGVNSRLDELQAAILERKLDYLPEVIKHRREVAQAYQEELIDTLVRPRVDLEVGHSHHLFVVATPWRNRLAARLKRENIGCGIHYPTPLHWMPALQGAGAPPSLPLAERMADQVLSLPCYPELSLEAVHRVCSVVNDELA